MKIHIFTEVGKDIGLGHISRCSSLYDEVISRGVKADFVVYGDVFHTGLLNGINTKNDYWLDENYLIDKISGNDYVIVDSYNAGIGIYEIISNLAKKALYIDDTGRLNYPKGIIVNPALDASQIQYLQSPDRVLLSGPEYVILRPPFIGLKRRLLNEEVRTVLISMGGADIRKLTPLIVSSICRKKPDIIFDIVIGLNDSRVSRRKYKENNNINIHDNINATDMMKLMINADLAITTASQTVHELIATQTPFIPIQIIENQENVVRSLSKYNPGHIVLRHDDENLAEGLLRAFIISNEFDYRKTQSLKYRNLIDGYGSKRIIDKLLDD